MVLPIATPGTAAPQPVMAFMLQTQVRMEHTIANSWGEALAAGVVGAVTLTAVHQMAQRISGDAPRMDALGERAIAKSLMAAGAAVPDPPGLHRWALVGDLAANSAYYALVACGRNANVWRRGLALGLAAGAGALLLPQRIGLGEPPRADRVANQVMTIAWYLVGGLAAAAAGQGLRARSA